MEIILLDQPMSGYLRRYLVQCNNNYQDFSVYTQDLTPKLIELCDTLIHELRSYKIHVRVKVQFEKTFDTNTTCEAFFSNIQTTILPATTVAQETNDILTLINNKIDEFCKNGSDWNVIQIARTDIHIARYVPLVASRSTYIELPRSISKKRAIVNVYNNDEECFKWAILSALQPAQHNPHRINNYRRYADRYNFQSYEFPFSIRDIPRFEEANNLSIFVYGFEDVVYPLHRPKNMTNQRVYLLMLQNTDTNKAHYCWIKDLNKLLHSRKKHGWRSFFCPLCLFSFNTHERADVHFQYCSSDNCAITMPTENQKALKFTSMSRMLRQPCVFYADFECILEACDTAIPSTSQSFTTPSSLHTPCGFGLFQVVQCCNNSQPIYPRGVKVQRHPDAVKLFLEYLVRRSIEYQNDFIENRQPMPVLTGQEWNSYFSSPNCCICDTALEATCNNCKNETNRRKWCSNCRSKINRDHCHICRAFRGPTHAACNISYKLSKDVCVFMHNLKRYDSHLIMQHIAPFANQNGYTIECIPKAMDSYLMFSLNMIPLHEQSGKWKIKFLDSIQFLSCSLDKLVNNLRESGEQSFPAMKSNFPQPDDLVTSTSKSSLTDTTVTIDEYSRAEEVWDAFQIQNLGQYHDLYLATDTLLLCDVIESFRTVCLRNYKLDPAHYVTLPSFGWDAVLRKSPVDLELLTDPDMYLFFESGIRGGVSTVTTRYAKANNPILPGFCDNLPISFIASFDANNLTGYAMSQLLPTSDFSWMSREELDNVDVSQISDDSDYGCILDVDLNYPEALHESHNDYPLAPERLSVTDDMLSQYSIDLKEKLHLGPSTQEKLIPNLHDKKSYIVHYRNLKLYLRLGMVVAQTNRGIKFKQHAWMQPYISFNTDQRKQAKSDFEKDIFKLLNNSVFGKSMENVRGYTNVELVTTAERVRHLVANPRFTKFEAFDNDLVAVMLRRKTIALKKPIFTGFTVLELSKHLMYQFHYDFIIPQFPRNRLLFTDTDSLTYHIQTNDLYQELNQFAHLFDFSDYPPEHALYSTENKKVMGKMKDETNGMPIEEFVGLRSKMYSIKCEAHSKKRAKGVGKIIVKKQMVHDDYAQALTEGIIMRHKCYQIKNSGHKLFTMLSNKISLSAYDDKRYILNNGIETVAFGHFMIENCKSQEPANNHDSDSGHDDNDEL